MDITIDFVRLGEKNLVDLNFEEPPVKVFVDLQPLSSINQEEFKKLISLYDKFIESSFFIVNVTENIKKQLRFLLERNKKIRIMPVKEG